VISLLVRSVLLLMAFMLIAIAGGLIALNTGWGHALIEKQLKTLIHPSLVVHGATDVSVFPDLQLTLNDVRIEDVDGNKAHLQIGEAFVRMAWWPLMHRTWLMHDLIISDITITRASSDVSDAGAKTGSTPARSRLPSWLSDWLVQFDKAPTQTWQVRLDRGVIERLTVRLAAPKQAVSQVLLQRADLAMDVGVLQNAAPSAWDALNGNVSLELQGLRVDEGGRDGLWSAWLEQWGVSMDSATDHGWVDGLQTVWTLADGQASLRTLKAMGPWGRVTAKQGTIELGNGQIHVPLQVVLTSEVNVVSRGISIRARHTELPMVITGTLRNPGLQSPGDEAFKRFNLGKPSR
jgi:hypothetical protein